MGQRRGAGKAGPPHIVSWVKSDALFPIGLLSPTSTHTMKPPTDYIRHAARLARKLQMDTAMGGTPQPDAEFYKALSKAFDEIAAGLEMVARPD
jgi:hypothetical protein